jgi:hypothetical protein
MRKSLLALVLIAGLNGGCDQNFNDLSSRESVELMSQAHQAKKRVGVLFEAFYQNNQNLISLAASENGECARKILGDRFNIFAKENDFSGGFEIRNLDYLTVFTGNYKMGFYMDAPLVSPDMKKARYFEITKLPVNEECILNFWIHYGER